MSTQGQDTMHFGKGGSTGLSPLRLAEHLGVTLSELARLAGVARSTLTAKSAAREVDAALMPIVRILVIATEMAGDESGAVEWFKHQPIPSWADRTAYDLVAEGRADQVLVHLEAVRSGVYS